MTSLEVWNAECIIQTKTKINLDVKKIDLTLFFLSLMLDKKE